MTIRQINNSVKHFSKNSSKRQNRNYFPRKYKNITPLLISYTKALPICRQNSTNCSHQQKDKTQKCETLMTKNKKIEKIGFAFNICSFIKKLIYVVKYGS